MASLHSENFTEEEYGSLKKRSRLDMVEQLRWDNPPDEPLPLGLKLKKSPSLLDSIEMMKLSGVNIESKPTEIVNKNNADKMKASNFKASLLRIGNWEYKSRYEGDVVAKFYFARRKLVWEVLKGGGLKSKIEIQWSDITALKAECPEDANGTLTIMLARRPAFFRETNPQPRKHIAWQASDDFTDGQASKIKVHYTEFPPGVLNKHYEKLIQCDTRLNILSQQREEIVVYPPQYFEGVMLDSMKNISQMLLSDNESASSMCLDEKSLMKKVNSLSCLLQQDPAKEICSQAADSGRKNVDCFDLVNDSSMLETQASEGEMPRRDSLGELLNGLPRIASLPKLLA